MPLPTDTDLRRARRVPIFDVNALQRVDYRRAHTERLLPHRGSFLLVDHITGLDVSQLRLAGTRELAHDDPVFADHFPGMPVYPGVLLIEMAGQHALCLPHFQQYGIGEIGAEITPAAVRLVRIRDASFVAEARPGDTLTILTQVFDDGGLTFMALAQILRGNDILCVILFEAMLIED